MLANVGLFIAHSKHHLHSYYVIRNAEHLAGFTDHEIELIALVARYHRKSAPKPSHEEVFTRLSRQDQRAVRTLAASAAYRHRSRSQPRSADRIRLRRPRARHADDPGPRPPFP